MYNNCVGWMTHRTRVTDVDIVIQPGWSQVPINRITELKEVVHDARDAYLTRVACEKMGTNLKLYRSLNTIKAPTIGLQAQLKRCMVAYSSGTNDDLVGKVSQKLLGKFIHNRLKYRSSGKDMSREYFHQRHLCQFWPITRLFQSEKRCR